MWKRHRGREGEGKREGGREKERERGIKIGDHKKIEGRPIKNGKGSLRK